jgi:hypothetical protein
MLTMRFAFLRLGYLLDHRNFQLSKDGNCSKYFHLLATFQARIILHFQTWVERFPVERLFKIEKAEFILYFGKSHYERAHACSFF